MKNISELFARIENARKRLGITDYPAWYRGHSDISYKLIPSLLRVRAGLKHERNIFAIFKNQAGSLIDRNFNSWTVLAIMQHYGVPTRLLDWSESLDVALFFAILGNPHNPCIWVLNPYRLNERATGHKVVYDDADPVPFDYYTTVRDATWPTQLPIAVAPPWISDRIKRQRGCFTIQGSDPRPLDEMEDRITKRIAIPTHLVGEIRHYFKRKDFDHFEIFPDLTGLAQSLIHQFRLV